MILLLLQSASLKREEFRRFVFFFFFLFNSSEIMIELKKNGLTLSPFFSFVLTIRAVYLLTRHRGVLDLGSFIVWASFLV